MNSSSTGADWDMAEVVYDVWAPLLHRKPAEARRMANEMQTIARRFAEEYMPDVAARLWPKESKRLG